MRFGRTVAWNVKVKKSVVFSGTTAGSQRKTSWTHGCWWRSTRGACDFFVDFSVFFLLTADYLFTCREQERELLFQKKGKRPRGRPRKIPLPEVAADCSSSSSSSGLSGPSSDDEEQVKKVKPGPRVQPGPQKRPQILLARPDPPRRKKRGRKPLHADLKTNTESPPQPSRHHHLIRPQRVELRPGMKKPLQPASFTYTGLTRTSRDESSTSSSFSHTSSKPGSTSGTWSNRSLNSSCGSASFNRTSPSPQNKMSLSELKRSVLDSSSFKTVPLKNTGAASSLGVPGGFGGGQVVQRSPLSLRKQEGVSGASCLLQHKQQNSAHAKPSSSPAHRDRINQALSLRTLNLQTVGRMPASGSHQGSTMGSGAGAATSRSNLRSIAGVVKGAADRIKDTRVSAGQGRTLPAGGVVKETLAGGTRLENRNPSRSVNELSAGDSDESSSSESEAAAALYLGNSRRSLGDDTNESDTETDWRPARSLLEHVFVTDVTANFLTVTVKESPTSVGFFSSGTH